MSSDNSGGHSYSWKGAWELRLRITHTNKSEVGGRLPGPRRGNRFGELREQGVN